MNPPTEQKILDHYLIVLSERTGIDFCKDDVLKYAGHIITMDKTSEDRNPHMVENFVNATLFDSKEQIENSIKWQTDTFKKEGIYPLADELGLKGSEKTIATNVIIAELLAKRAGIARAQEWAEW